MTFEGPEHYSEIISITDGRMGDQLKQLTLGLVRHLQVVSDGAIDVGRIVLHFKIDAQERVWFLWCSSLRLVRSSLSSQPTLPMALQNELQVSPRMTHAGFQRNVVTLSTPGVALHLEGAGGWQGSEGQRRVCVGTARSTGCLSPNHQP